MTAVACCVGEDKFEHDVLVEGPLPELINKVQHEAFITSELILPIQIKLQCSMYKWLAIFFSHMYGLKTPKSKQL